MRKNIVTENIAEFIRDHDHQGLYTDLIPDIERYCDLRYKTGLYIEEGQLTIYEERYAVRIFHQGKELKSRLTTYFGYSASKAVDHPINQYPITASPKSKKEDMRYQIEDKLKLYIKNFRVQQHRKYITEHEFFKNIRWHRWILEYTCDVSTDRIAIPETNEYALAHCGPAAITYTFEYSDIRDQYTYIATEDRIILLEWFPLEKNKPNRLGQIYGISF